MIVTVFNLTISSEEGRWPTEIFLSRTGGHFLGGRPLTIQPGGGANALYRCLFSGKKCDDFIG